MISYKRDVLERQIIAGVKMSRGFPICERVRKKIVEYFKSRGRPFSALSAFSSKASISDGMGVHKSIQYGQLACFGRHYEC